MMKALFYSKHGNSEQDILGELPKPNIEDLKEGEMLLEIYAASINPVDYKQRQGGPVKYILKYPLPRIHGFDFAGRIIGKGDKIDNYEVDDVVFGMCNGVEKGSVAEFMVVKSKVCTKLPKNLTPVECVGIPLVGLTTMYAFRDGGFKENDETLSPRVLILGGAGGVGTCAIQLAKNLYNASFIATTASLGKKTELCTELGADLVINYKKDPNFEELNKIEKFDFIFDTCGSLYQSLNYIKEGGVIISIAEAPTVEGLRDFVTESEPNLAFGVKSIFFSKFGEVVINKALGATGVRNKLLKSKARYNHIVGRGNGEMMNILREELENERLIPIIDKTYSFEEAKEAIKYLETGRATGKVIIQIKEP